jgi:hypothetical protein
MSHVIRHCAGSLSPNVLAPRAAHKSQKTNNGPDSVAVHDFPIATIDAYALCKVL